MSSGVGGVPSSSSFDGGGPTPPIKNEFSIAGGKYSATVIVGTLEKYGYKMKAGSQEDLLNKIGTENQEQWDALLGKVQSVVEEVLGQAGMMEGKSLKEGVELQGFFSKGVKVKDKDGAVKYLDNVKTGTYSDQFKDAMEKVVELAKKAGVVEELPKEEVGLGFTPTGKTPPRPNPLKDLTMQPYEGVKGDDFTGNERYTKKDAIAGYLNQFVAENPGFIGVFVARDGVVDESASPPKFKDDFIATLNAFIATAHVEESSTEGTAMEGNLIDDFRKAVLERVQAAVVLNPQINDFVDGFLNSDESGSWGDFKKEKLTALSGADEPLRDVLAAGLKTLLADQIDGKIMGLANSEEGISKDALTQAKKILTEEFSEAYHPGLNDLTFEEVEEETGEVFAIPVLSNKNSRRGVAWAMTQLGGLKGEREKYFDGDELKGSNPPLPDPTGSVVGDWGSDAGKAALAYFEAGLGAKFPEGEE
jgi:hypothetical protein